MEFDTRCSLSDIYADTRLRAHFLKTIAVFFSLRWGNRKYDLTGIHHFREPTLTWRKPVMGLDGDVSLYDCSYQ